MSDTVIEFDDKTNKLTVDNRNLLESARKDYKDLLLINPFQFYVEVPFDGDVPNEAKLLTAIEDCVRDLERDLEAQFKDLVDQLKRLQKEERAGNKKAGSEAEGKVKALEKKMKKYPTDFNVEVRKAAQKFISKQKGGSKMQLRSTGRSAFRGFKLQKEAFEFDGGDAEYSPFFATTCKSLMAHGKTLLKLANSEKTNRQKLADEVGEYKKAVLKTPKYETMDAKDLSKTNNKAARAVESTRDGYLTTLEELEKVLEEAGKDLAKIEKLQRTDDAMKESDEIEDSMKKTDKSFEVVKGIIEPRRKMATAAGKLLKENFGDGKQWDDMVTELTALKGATKSAQALIDLFDELSRESK